MQCKSMAFRARSLRLNPLAACLATALMLGMSAPVESAIPLALSHAAFVPKAQKAQQRTRGLAAKSALEPMAPWLPQGSGAPVSNCNDSGPGSLRDAVQQATDTVAIDLTQLQCSTITLTSGAIATNVFIALLGPGADSLAIDGGGSSRLFTQTGDVGLGFYNLTLRNGSAPYRGGCIYATGSVFLQASTVSGCQATDPNNLAGALGGGIYAQALYMYNSRLVGNSTTSTYFSEGGGALAFGSMLIVDSTIASNTAPGGRGGGLAGSRADIRGSTISGNQAAYGGGLYLTGFASPTPSISASTISGNNAVNGGGASFEGPVNIYNSTIAYNTIQGGATGGLFVFTTANLQSTIVARNFTGTGSGYGDIGGSTGSGSSLSGANNLIMVSTLAVPAGTISADPLLGPLAGNGGPTLTHALLSASPAIDTGNNAHVSKYDQRGGGFTRIGGAAPDIGAFETQSTGRTTAVANCADSGLGSLRDTIEHAASGDTLDLRQLACGTITLTTGGLYVGVGNLTLLGPGAQALTIDGDQLDRIFDHGGYGTLHVSGLTLTNGLPYLASGRTDGGCIRSFSSVELADSTLSHCQAANASGESYGGGIASVRLDMSRSTVTGNSATTATGTAHGGGIYTQHHVQISNSTISDNSATSARTDAATTAGGIQCQVGDTLIVGTTISGNAADSFGGIHVIAGSTRIVNSTISGNTAAFAVGGGNFNRGVALYNSSVAFNSALPSAYSDAAGVSAEGLVRLQSSIIFGNAIGPAPSDLGGRASIAGANNLVGTSQIPLPPDTLNVDPLLGPLQDNGGPTLTHALLSGSPAIDAGNNVANLSTDQRGSGFARVGGAAADIGAFEVQPINDLIFRDGFE